MPKFALVKQDFLLLSGGLSLGQPLGGPVPKPLRLLSSGLRCAEMHKCLEPQQEGENMGGWEPTSLLVGINPWPSSWGIQAHVSERTVWFGTLRFQ